MTLSPEPNLHARHLVTGLLITLAVGVSLGRLASAERLHEPSVHRADGASVPRPAWPRSRPDPWPTFSSNDRSRWALVRALVDEGTFVIGRRDPVVVLASGPTVLAATTPFETAVLLQLGYQSRIKSDSGIIFEDGWQSVDKVLHPSRLEFYSTKPPLLPVMVAGIYWVLKNSFGLSIVEDRWVVMRSILVVINILPFWLYLALLASLANRLGATDWGCYYIVAAGGFATLVSPFLISFNNHTIATAGVVVGLYALVRIREGGGMGWDALAGLAAGFSVCNELPSLAFAVGIGVYLLWRSPPRTLGVFVPMALLPVAAMVGLNYVELGQWKPAYAEFGTPWYEYEGSHWRVPPDVKKSGIDFAGRNGEPKEVYAFHLLLGHHGWFSLMPIMVLGLGGMILGMLTRPRSANLAGMDQPPGTMRLLALFSFLVSSVVIGFYLYESDNYGGWSNGPRWLMWLTPLWLLCLLPVVDRLAPSRAGRSLALVLLACSILSMSYQMWNPWRHPWIYNWMESRGWINY